MATKASDIEGEPTFIRGGRIEVDVDMILKIEGGSCGVQGQDGNIITYKGDYEIVVLTGCAVYIQLSTVTFTKS
jgi:hypothetical protein